MQVYKSGTGPKPLFGSSPLFFRALTLLLLANCSVLTFLLRLGLGTLVFVRFLFPPPPWTLNVPRRFSDHRLTLLFSFPTEGAVLIGGLGRANQWLPVFRLLFVPFCDPCFSL